MNRVCDACGAPYEGKRRKDCPVCGTPFGKPEGKKLPAGTLSFLIPSALCIAVLVGLVIYAILSEAFYPGRRWVEPPVTAEEVVEEAAFGEKIDLSGVTFTCHGFDRVAGAADSAGAAVYAFYVSWENETGEEVALSTHSLSVDTGYRSYEPIELSESFLYGEFTLRPGESMTGWVCIPMPESAVNTTLWIDSYFYTLRAEGETVKTAPGKLPRYLSTALPENPEEVLPEH